MVFFSVRHSSCWWSTGNEWSPVEWRPIYMGRDVLLIQFMFRLWLLLCVSKSFQSKSTTMRYHRSDCHTFNIETLYCVFANKYNVFFRQVFGIRRSVLFCDEPTTIYSIHYEYDRVFKYCAGEWIQSKWMNEELKRKKKPRRLTYTYESMCSAHISNPN